MSLVQRAGHVPAEARSRASVPRAAGASAALIHFGHYEGYQGREIYEPAEGKKKGFQYRQWELGIGLPGEKDTDRLVEEKHGVNDEEA